MANAGNTTGLILTAINGAVVEKIGEGRGLKHGVERFQKEEQD